MEEDIRFGDIYSNGINYWMVVSVTKPSCDCGCHASRHELRPVVLKDGKPVHFVGYYEGQIKDIMPHSWLHSRAEWEHVTSQDL